MRPATAPLTLRLGPGVLAASVVALVATGLDAVADRLTGTGPLSWLGALGPPVIALLLGVVVVTVRGLPAGTAPGLSFAASRVLQAAVVVLGLTVSVDSLRTVGLPALPVVVVAVTTSLLSAAVVGRLLRVDPDLRTLIGVGTGICGASAVAATAGVLRARPADISYALSTVVLFNLAAVLSFPLTARAIGLGDEGFGVWAGSAVNDTSAVVAVATAWGGGAVAAAVVVKLTRVLALVPVTLVLAWRRGAADGEARWGRRLVPGFIVLFVLAVLASGLGLVPATLAEVAKDAATVMVTLALAAVGLSTRLRAVLQAGWSPLLLGGVVWAAVATATLVSIRAVGLG